jgi:hypothetical protein
MYGHNCTARRTPPAWTCNHCATVKLTIPAQSIHVSALLFLTGFVGLRSQLDKVACDYIYCQEHLIVAYLLTIVAVSAVQKFR